MSRNSWERSTGRNQQVTRKSQQKLRVEELEDRSVPSVTGFRTGDGVGNNEANPMFGTAGIDLIRLSPEAYRTAANDPNGFFTPSMNGGAPFFVAGSRLVSNALSSQSTVLFGTQDINTVNGNGLSNFGYTWGQFLDHDMGLTPDTPVNDFPIPVDPTHPEDPIASLRMGRSVFNPATGTTNPREQINVNTAFIDLSQVYGSTTSVSNALRTFSGGLLKSSPGADGVVNTGDDLMPYNNTTYFTAEQIALLHMANDVHLVPETELFAAGDVRANETTELSSLHTLFLRNHNRVARALYQSHPGWSDEDLYQTARKVNIAQAQAITYNGYLPALLGPTAMPVYAGYNAAVNPAISTEFSTVAFRFGHSLLNNMVPRDADDGSSLGEVPLILSFFNPRLLTPGGVVDPVTGIVSTDIGAVLKGNADNNAQAMDELGVSAIRNLLFGQGGSGEDLIARDMWRAHDHGIGTYNDMRIAIGLPPNTDDATHGFGQISSDPDVVAKLGLAYTGPTREQFLLNGKHAGDIDPFAAGIAEDHVPGSDLGPLFHAYLVDQFVRLRSGDRYFYLNESMTMEEASLLQAGDTLSEVIKANTTITQLQNDVFRFLKQQDGRAKGYYANVGGRTELTGSSTGTQLNTAIHSGLVAALANPDQPGKTVLVDIYGNYVSTSSLQSYSYVKNFLQNVSTDNVANKMSVHMLATEFNILLGKVDANASIYVPAIILPPDSGDEMNQPLQQELQERGVSNSSGIASLQAILDAAKASLRVAPDTSDTSDERLFQRALRGCFVAINANEAIFIV